MSMITLSLGKAAFYTNLNDRVSIQISRCSVCRFSRWLIFGNAVKAHCVANNDQ